jgi:tRNA(adenine34) deaminase
MHEDATGVEEHGFDHGLIVRDRDTFAIVTPADYMREALAEARRGLAAGEVPIGAVLVIGDRIVARAYNQPIAAVDPTAHAEVLVVREAAKTVGNYRLTEAVVYVTVEPCMMCVGALVHARVREVVFGAAEPKTGALVSTIRLLEVPQLNHRFAVAAGVLEEESRDLIQQFFRGKRRGSEAGRLADGDSGRL